MSSTASVLTASRVRWLVTAAIVLGVAVVVGVDVHAELVPALEQCAPTCEFRG
jgi:hypothetical protein